jgi:hypothetical protein
MLLARLFRHPGEAPELRRRLTGGFLAAQKIPGDFALAVEQCDTWIAAVADGPSTVSSSTVLANREIAAEAFCPVDLASWR